MINRTVINTIKKCIPNRYYTNSRDIYNFVRYIYYKGNKVECRCCGGRFRKFLSFGAPPRPDVQCPMCRSLERHRLMWLYLEEKTNIYKDSLKVLHVAPEIFLTDKLISKDNIEYLSGDLFSPTVMVKMDITDIQYSDNTFDVILCSHVLEHVPEDKKAMSEIYRVLKPGGWAILQVPIDFNNEETYEDSSINTPEGRLRAFGQDDHVRMYGMDYPKKLSDAGFDVKVDEFVKELGQDIIERYRLDIKEDIYYCKKLL